MVKGFLPSSNAPSVIAGDGGAYEQRDANAVDDVGAELGDDKGDVGMLKPTGVEKGSVEVELTPDIDVLPGGDVTEASL